MLGTIQVMIPNSDAAAEHIITRASSYVLARRQLFSLANLSKGKKLSAFNEMLKSVIIWSARALIFKSTHSVQLNAAQNIAQMIIFGDSVLARPAPDSSQPAVARC